MTSSEQGVQVAAIAKAPTPEPLGFERIDVMIDAVAASQAGSKPGRLERGAFVVGLLGPAVGFPIAWLLAGPAAVWFAAAGLAIELIGLGLSGALALKRHWWSVRHARRDFARELDRDFDHYRRFVAELRRFPKTELEARLRYVRGRVQALQHGLGLFTGGFERLGILPVVGLLYLQFRDWRWNDWGWLAEMNLLQGLLIWALLLVYVAGWQLAILHRRIQAYELLLAEAVHPDGGVVSVEAPAAWKPVR